MKLPPPGTKKKILVIDDERRLAESLSTLLRGVGYLVKPTFSGEEGLSALQSENFDLVITDLRMDGIDGFDIMHRLAEIQPETPLVVITGHASTESAIEAIHQHVADYIPKPFDFDYLRSSIARILAKREAEQFRRDMLHMLSHDIKVPLTSVQGFAQLIVKRTQQELPEASQYAEIVLVNTQRIIMMLDNYLTNARVEEGRFEALRTSVQLEDVVADVLQLIAIDFRKKSISISCNMTMPAGPIMLDEPLFMRAVANLLSNAAKYTPDGGAVEVTASVRHAHLHFDVSNSGPGIAADEVPHLFERYQRAKSSGRGIEGTGLGLYVVRCVTAAHGGRATCESEPGRTTFSMIIPVTE